MPTSPKHRAAIDAAIEKFMHTYGPPTERDPERMAEVYAEVLADIAPIDIESATLAVLRTQERGFPTPALMRRHALTMQQARLDLSTPTLGGERDPDACPRCGATGFWYRKGVAPAWGIEGTPQYHPARPFERVENLHDKGCPLRHPDQDEEPKPRVRVYPLSSGDSDR